MNRFTWLPATVLLMAGVATAQPAPEGPPAARTDEHDEEEEGASHPGHGWEAVDRPLARALAYERRDVVEELLRSPGSVSAASAAELAEDVRIPRPHADKVVAAVRAGRPLETLESILRAGLPAGVEVGELVLNNASSQRLVEAGLTEAQAREFLRFRTSGRRVYQHFREVKAIAEARAAGAAEMHARSRDFMKLTTAEKVRTVARALGLTAPAAEAELARLERLPAAEARARRARLLEAGTEGGRDALASFRRSDGTIEWQKFAKDQAFRGASGVTHFAFAMFLKELAIVMRTGDRTRLEEFVDGLMSTDFFVNYGLFAAGASAADVAYGRYVRRITRKQFLSGVLRSNLVLAAGLAVPMVARGQFELDTYLVDVAALGLSATAVKAAVEGTKGIYKLVRGARPLVNLGRLSGPVGWVYSAGEAAVVLLIADHLAARFDRFLDERALRKKVREAQERLDSLTRRLRAGESIDEAILEAALAEYGDSYDALRRDRLRGLESRLGEFRAELDSAGRTAHIGDTAVNGLRSALERNPALRATMERRYGSVENYLEHEAARRNAPVEARMREASSDFDRDWSEELDTAYVGGEPAPADPTPAEGSRLALYDDETAHLLRALDGTSDPEARRLIALAIERVRIGRRVDTAVYEAGRGGPTPAAPVETPTASAPVPAEPPAEEDPASVVGVENRLRRDLGLAPAGADAPPATTADAPPAEEAAPAFEDALEYADDGLPGSLVPAMGPTIANAGDEPYVPADALEYDDAGLPLERPAQATVTESPAAERPAQATVPTASGEHVVVRGETLSGIARRHGTTVARLVALNGIANADLILVGQRLRLPPAAEPARVEPARVEGPPVFEDALEYDDAGLPRRAERPSADVLEYEDLPLGTP